MFLQDAEQRHVLCHSTSADIRTHFSLLKHLYFHTATDPKHTGTRTAHTTVYECAVKLVGRNDLATACNDPAISWGIAP